MQPLRVRLWATSFFDYVRSLGASTLLRRPRPIPTRCFSTVRTARIVSRTPLVYTDDVGDALDRPAFVRAASGIAWFGGELAIIQDDASLVALVNPQTQHVRAIPLPGDRHGLRQFDKLRGNKRDKLDLECCFVVRENGVETLFALGSGSSAKREVIVRVRTIEQGGSRVGYDVQTTNAHGFYAGLRAQTGFSGSELNLEGAVVRGPWVVLFQRGNGAPRGGVSPINATCQVNLDCLVRYLDDSEHTPAPSPHHIKRHDLGSIGGVPLTFTDATQSDADHGILFLASAEASPNAVDDGEVVGTVLGAMDHAGATTLISLEDEQGKACRDKVEGVVLAQHDASRAWLVVDADDATRPALLLDVRLERLA